MDCLRSLFPPRLAKRGGVPAAPHGGWEPGRSHGWMHTPLDVLLHRAQEAGAVRAGISSPDLIALLKGMLSAIQNLPGDPANPATRGRVLAVISEGLRPPR